MLSLAMPAFEAGTSESGGIGLAVVLTGWFGMLTGEWSGIVWIANPILYLAWILYKVKPVLALQLGGLSFAIAVSFLFCEEIMINEGGGHAKISKFAVGYWIWMMSMGIFFFGNLYLFYKRKRSTAGQEEPKNIFE